MIIQNNIRTVQHQSSTTVARGDSSPQHQSRQDPAQPSSTSQRPNEIHSLVTLPFQPSQVISWWSRSLSSVEKFNCWRRKSRCGAAATRGLLWHDGDFRHSATSSSHRNILLLRRVVSTAWCKIPQLLHIVVSIASAECLLAIILPFQPDDVRVFVRTQQVKENSPPTNYLKNAPALEAIRGAFLIMHGTAISEGQMQFPACLAALRNRCTIRSAL